MSTSPGFGKVPDQRLIYFTANQDFEAIVTNKEGSWPVGTTLTYVFDNAVSWAHDSISGADAYFTRDKAVAATVPDGTTYQLRYVNGTVDRVLAQGKAVWTAIG